MPASSLHPTMLLAGLEGNTGIGTASAGMVYLRAQHKSWANLEYETNTIGVCVVHL
jgi:hypothetical protein